MPSTVMSIMRYEINKIIILLSAVLNLFFLSFPCELFECMMVVLLRQGYISTDFANNLRTISISVNENPKLT